MYSILNKKTHQFSFVKSLSLVLVIALTGCQTFKGAAESNQQVAESALTNAAGYYSDAKIQIAKENYVYAESKLKDLRTFYPSHPLAKQALLDIIYVQFNQHKYEEAVASSKTFISLYPNHQQVDYAYYVQGVANMTIPVGRLNLFKKNQAERDTAHYRLAYDSFNQLTKKYPSSIYANDAAQRMTFLYNQFAEHQLHIAKWYIEREAYVAAANRAKIVFQNFPRSESIPEAVAMLAHCYDKLGMQDLSTEYKNLLALNYPHKLDGSGNIVFNSKNKLSVPMPKTFNKVELNLENKPYDVKNVATKTQTIYSLEDVRKANSQ